MPKGTPLCLRCPKCKDPWPEQIGNELKVSRSNTHGSGSGGPRFLGHKGIVSCRTCKYVWASTHPLSGRMSSFDRNKLVIS